MGAHTVNEVGVTMPKLLCVCGFVHDMSPIPDDGYHVVPDRSYDRFLAIEHERQRADLREPTTEDRLTALDQEQNAIVSLMYECPKCGRLAWLKNHIATFYERVVPDPEDVNRLGSRE